SWELGTRSQAIVELNATTYSVFSNTSLPPPTSVEQTLVDPMSPFFAIARSIVQGRAQSNNDTVGPQPLIQDGSAADPASIGVSVLLANWTGQDGGQLDYSGAAKDQLDFLLQKVPRTSDGAISHRVSTVQLWSDFVYMVPPFLAYYGVITQNRTLLEESYTQIKLYRSYLRDPTANMWKHVLPGTSGNDDGYWSTGNGWAAAGMLRVLATIRQSEYANTMKSEQNDLITWVGEIHSGIYATLDSTNIFTNYANQSATAPGNFYDASSTAIISSTVYRLAVIANDHSHIPAAEQSRKTLSNSTGTDTNTLANSTHFTADGWLLPVVNPLSYRQQGSESPEAQAFVIEMHAAWKDWVAAGSKGANEAGSKGGSKGVS
ncbi:uncharacterized protein LACBIDRAFT_144731, partial [Laccaria bicolor S238N-H82]